MATRATQGGASASPAMPLDLILSAIPSLPRPILSRLTARLIDHLDELDGDTDLEDDDPAEEDDHAGGNVEDEPQGREDEDTTHDFRPIADPQAYREHRSRIRRTRTYMARRIDARRWGGGVTEDRRLIHEPNVPSKRQLLRRKRGMPRRPRG